jgi:hypothetical protein
MPYWRLPPTEQSPARISSISVVLIGGQSPEEVELNMPSDTTPGQPDGDAHVDADHAPDESTPSAAIPPAPASAPLTSVLATQSREDTDVGWGEYRERDDDDRLLRDRPPHWDNA